MKRYLHSLRHNVATKGFIGAITPFLSLEVAPGDTFSGRIYHTIRMSPMVKPCLTPFYLNTYLFYIPHRLVWDNWESFLANGPDPDDPAVTPSVAIPAVELPILDPKDYWEIETAQWPGFRLRANVGEGSDPTLYYNALRLRAYNLVYNEYFRDEQWQLVAPDDWQTPALWNGLLAGQTKNYWTQIRERMAWPSSQSVPVVNDAVDVTEMLRGIAKQKLAMKRQTYGTRYVDILRSYGISVNYQMLQRPEVVATARQTLNIHDVVSTNKDQATEDFLTGIAGHSVTGARLSLRRKSFPEHGTLLGVAVVRPVEQTDLCDWFDSPRRFENFYDPGCTVLPPSQVTEQTRYGSETEGDPSFVGNSIGRMPWGDWYRSHPSWHAFPEYRWAAVDPQTFRGTRAWTAYGGGGQKPFREQWSQFEPGRFNVLFANAILPGGNDPFPDPDRSGAPIEGHYQMAAANALTARRLIPKANLAVFNGTT